MLQKLGNDPIEFAYSVMQAPLLSTPVGVDLEILPLIPHRVSFRDDSSLALLDIVSLSDDASSDSGQSSQSSLFCDMNEELLDELQGWEVEISQWESTNLQFGSNLTKDSNDKCINSNSTPKTTTQYNEYHHHHSYYSGYHCCPHYSHYPNHSHCYTGQLESSLRGQYNLLARLYAINETQQTEITNLKQRCTILEMQVMHCHLAANEQEKNKRHGPKKTRRCQLKKKNPNGPKKPTLNRRCGVCREYSCKGLGEQILCPKHPASVPKQKDGIVSNPKKRQKRQCRVCLEYGPEGVIMNCEKGSGNQKKCKFFMLDGSQKCQLCQKYDPKELKINCVVGAGDQVLCKNFELNGTPKVQT